MKKLKSIREMDKLFETTQDYLDAREWAACQDKLNDISQCEETKAKAKNIAELNSSCDQCIYCDGVTESCHVPYSDAVMEDLDIDPCYEGVLSFLSKEKEEKNGFTVINDDGTKHFVAEEKLEQFINNIHASAYENLDTIRTLAELILDMEEKKYRLGEPALNFIRSLYNDADQTLKAENL